MRSILFYHLILVYMAAGLIDQDQYRYLKKRNIDCGIEYKVENYIAATRMINAEPSKKIYPWMAIIWLKRFKSVQFISTTYEKHDLFFSGGTVISDRAILTCGHCICNHKEPSWETPYILSCLPDKTNDASNREANQ